MKVADKPLNQQGPNQPEDGIRALLAQLVEHVSQLPLAERAALTHQIQQLQAALAEAAVSAGDDRRVQQAQRASEAHQNYLLRLSDALRPLADPAAVQAEAARVLGEHLGVERVIYGEVSEDGEDLVVARSYVTPGAPPLTGRFHMADFGTVLLDVAKSGRAVVVPDAETSGDLSPAEREAYRALGIAAFVGVPIIKEGRLVANLNVHSAAPRAWNETDLALILETAERTWAEVMRARAEASVGQYRTELESRLQQRTAVLQALVSASAQALYRMNPDWSELRQMEGGGFLSDTSQPDRGWVNEYIHPDDQEWVLEKIQQAIADGLPIDLEHRVLRADGSLGWTASRAVPVRSEAGEIVEWFGAASDITERKSAEQALSQANAELEEKVKERTAALATANQQLEIEQTALATANNQLEMEQAALRRNQAFLNLVIESLPVGVGYIDTNGRLLLANQEMLRFLPKGLMPSIDDTQYGRWWGMHPDGRRLERSDYPGQRALRGERVLPGVEMRYLQDDGSEIWVNVAAIPIEDEAGQVSGVLSVATDIDAAKKAAQALHETEERFRRSVDNLQEAFIIYEAVRRDGEIVDLRYIYVNEEACKIHRLANDQLLGRTFLEVNPGLRDSILFDQYRQVVKSGQPLQMLQTIASWQGTGTSQARGLFDMRASKLDDGLIVTANDVTERVRLEAANQEAAKQREIHHLLAQQREKERQSYARDIHDGPIQTLSSLAFSIQNLKESHSDPTLRQELEQVTASVKNAVHELRQVMNELRPPAVLRFGLAKAIRVHAENLREQQPEIHWHIQLSDDHSELLSEQMNLAMYRIYQEAVKNILRHALAREVWVSCQIEPQQAWLEVQDDGQGFDETLDYNRLVSGQHFGLAGIAEWVETLNGQLEISSQPNAGTTIRVRVPLDGRRGFDGKA